jgi:hypothetical protein
MRKFLNSHKIAVVMCVVSILSIASCVLPACADDSGDVIDSSFAASLTSSIQQISVNILGAIAIIAPIALGIVGIFLAWGYGMKFFKKLSK